MKYPDLVPQRLCTVPIHITVTSEELNEDGEPMTLIDNDYQCNYQDKAKTILTAEQKIVQITGSAYICGDIAPDVAVISGGTATVYGVERRILQGTKARNPDGSVNYTHLELI